MARKTAKKNRQRGSWGYPWDCTDMSPAEARLLPSLVMVDDYLSAVAREMPTVERRVISAKLRAYVRGEST